MSFYPDEQTFRSLLLAAQEAGADIIEVGIPFSDPIADGLTIQEAGQTALSSGASPRRTLKLLRNMRKEISVPLVIMTYANLILQYEPDRFLKDASLAGAAGIVIPDLILEESVALKASANRHGIDLIQFIAPTTRTERLHHIAEAAQGFIYLVSVTGVTGARPGQNFDLKRYVRAIHKAANVPVCVGFGIATPAQAASVAEVADGVIIGSAIIQAIKKHKSNPVKAAGRFLRKVRKAMDARGD
jgi:tryptophan synthase alpha chain